MVSLDRRAPPAVVPLTPLRPGHDDELEFRDFFWWGYPRVMGLLRLVVTDQERAELISRESFVDLRRRWRRVTSAERPDHWVREAALHRARHEVARAIRRDRALFTGLPALAEIEPLAGVDTRTALADVSSRARARSRRRTTLVATGTVLGVALAALAIAAVDDGGRRNDVVWPPSPVNWILAETSSGLALVDPEGVTRPAPDPKGTLASWSPDGGQIAYVVEAGDSSSDLWMASVITPRQTRLEHCAGCHVVGADWSPDGAVLAYTLRLPDGTSELRVILGSRMGTRTRTMADLGTGAWGWPRWSPDGTSIAIAEGTGAGGFIDVLPVDSVPTTPPAPRAGPPRRIAGPIEGLDRVSWSPDGHRIAYTAGAGTADLFVVGADGSGTRQVTHSLDGTRVFAVEWESDPDHPFLVSIAGPGHDDAFLGRVSADGTSVEPIYQDGAPVRASRAAYRF